MPSWSYSVRESGSLPKKEEMRALVRLSPLTPNAVADSPLNPQQKSDELQTLA